MWRFLTHCAAFDWHPSPLSAAGWGCGEIFWHQFRFFTPGGAAVEYRVNRCYYVLFFWGGKWDVFHMASFQSFPRNFLHNVHLFTSFSRHAEPGSLFSGAEIDVHVIRHNLLPKVSHRTDDVNYFAILIFGLDSVGMDISVSRSVAVVWSRLKTQTIECLAMKFGTDIHFCTVVVSMSLSGHFCVSLYCSVFLVCFCACRPVCFPSITSITPLAPSLVPLTWVFSAFFHLHPLNSLVSVLVIRHLLCLPTFLFSYLFLIFFIVEIQSYLWWTGLQIDVLILVIY